MAKRVLNAKVLHRTTEIFSQDERRPLSFQGRLFELPDLGGIFFLFAQHVMKSCTLFYLPFITENMRPVR